MTHRRDKKVNKNPKNPKRSNFLTFAKETSPRLKDIKICISVSELYVRKNPVKLEELVFTQLKLSVTTAGQELNFFREREKSIEIPIIVMV